ncbi:MAG: autotransporter [Phenylobacterium sp.]|nr:autotransporter [Phenylobacterium sp.]
MTGKFPPRGPNGGRAASGNPRKIGASLVSLSALIWATQAFADSTVSNDRTTPINTSSANNGAADNVVINSGASVKPPSGAAVTVDSDNTVSNSGTIQIQDKSDATGILVLGGHTGSVSNAGTITINETTTAADTNGDGVLDGPFATGANRFGIRLTGSQPFIGDINHLATGTITVQGNDSAGISLEGSLQGSLSSLGSVTVAGDRAVGVRTGAVSGSVTAGGAISAQGLGAQGVVVGGDVAGAFTVNGSVSATGYRVPIRSTDATAVAKLIASDLLQGGPAVSVAGSVGGGVLIDTLGVVATSSAAPGLQVGAVGRDITLGNVGTGTDAFGIEIRGTASGAGVYDNVSATAVRIGVAGGGAVNTGGGLHITGSAIATSVIADATGVQLLSGANVPLLQNDGAITASITNALGNTARGLLIQAGANLPALANSSSITATVNGTSGDAIAIQDLSGTLTSLQNIRTIAASIGAPTGSVATGRTIAVDVSANTSGVSLLQYDASGGTTPPSITGQVLFGSGNDHADIQAGTVTGDIAFGAGANVLNISGGAKVTGALTAQGGTLALSIGSGALQINSTNTLNLTSLNLGGQSALTLTVDPAAGANTTLNVAGPATLSDGAKLGLRFTSLQQGAATYTLIHASQLTAGTLDTSLLGAAPFLYGVSLSTSAAQGTVSAVVTRKTADQLGLSTAAAAALDPVLQAVDRQAPLRDAILAQTDSSGFQAAYNQLLPSRSSAIFQLSAAQGDAVGRALDDRQGAFSGAWVQELNFGASENARDGLPGYRAWGVGLVGGYEAALSPLAILGLTFGASSSQVRELAQADTGKLTAETLEGGLYWRASAGRFSANARVAGGYLSMTGDRAVAINPATSTGFAATASSRWNGWTASGRFHVAYDAELGPVFLRPQLAVDYAQLSEAGHTESGGGAGVDLILAQRTSSRTSGFAGVAIGTVFGEQATWGPELLIGYRDVVSEKLGATTAQFASGGAQFVVPAEQIGGQGFAARLSFKGENGYGGFAVEGGGELRDGLAIYDLRLTAHLQF